MTGLVDMIRGKLDKRCLVTRLGSRKCRVKMKGAPSPSCRLIVNFDKPGSPLPHPARRCDYLLVAEGGHTHGWVAVLELKGGRVHDVDDAVRQLQAGASAAEGLIPKNEPVCFRPVVVSRSISTHERNLLKKKSCAVRFRGRIEPVLLMSCGAALAKVLYS